MAFEAMPARASTGTVPGAATELARLKAGDPRAWSSLFESTHAAIYRAALAHLRDPHLAEDVMAQVYLEALAGIRRYQDRGKPLLSWLLAIARQRSLDALRRRQRERARNEPLERRGDVEAPPDEPSAGLLEALRFLTPEQREVLHLRFVEDFSLEQVACLTGRSVGAVKALQHRALARLRTVLADSSASMPEGGTP